MAAVNLIRNVCTGLVRNTRYIRAPTVTRLLQVQPKYSVSSFSPVYSCLTVHNGVSTFPKIFSFDCSYQLVKYFMIENYINIVIHIMLDHNIIVILFIDVFCIT